MDKTWDDGHLLGFDPMDEVHEEFFALMAALETALDAAPTTAASRALADALDELARHSREHFRLEERWMDETAFPARDCHRDEHAAVLASMAAVQRRLSTGETAPVRRLAQALREWFPGHATHLDSALAQWMCRRRFGGAPVVLRRTLPLAELDGATRSPEGPRR